MRGLPVLLCALFLADCTCTPGSGAKRDRDNPLDDPLIEDPIPRRDVIYLVTLESKLLAFDPVKPGMSAYSTVGDLECNRRSSPQSMAVDRNGIAWVFYSSGDLYWVSTADASCQPTKYVHPSRNTQLGMAFTSVRPNAKEEQLYIASSSFGLATVDTDSLRVSNLSSTPVKGELAGGSDAKLFMFTPSTFGDWEASKLDEVDRSSFQPSLLHTLGQRDALRAWAFARYGGLFYIFTSESGEASKCTVVDVEGKIERVRDRDIGFVIVGAGQSTLVPQRDTGAPLRGDFADGAPSATPSTRTPAPAPAQPPAPPPPRWD